jgi:two-component system phosphate regulon sensor histidine kinase PhoR
VRRIRLFWQLFPTYLLITVLSLLGAAWYASGSIRQFHLHSVREDLEARAHLVADQIAGSLGAEGMPELDRLCKKLGRSSATRITVVLPDGRVIADSEENPAKMENHAGRIEVSEALSGGTGASTRYSETLKSYMMYVAIPVQEGKRIDGVVRTALPLTTIGRALYPVYAEIVLISTVIALAAVLLSLVVARRISRPLEEIKRGAERFADGDFSPRLPAKSSDEISTLAETMNKMAAQLDDRIRAITQQSSEQQAILSSMVEGVLAVDEDGLIIRANRAAADMLSLTREEVEGKSAQTAIRNTAVREFTDRVLSASAPAEDDIVIESDDEQRFLHLHGAVLRDNDSQATGAVIVLNDVTRLRKLENIRREFVANVSHELKTPITSVKGFVETLQDGALGVREDAERFLGIIASELDRLNSIIEDLLLLSRVEQDTEEREITVGETIVGDVLKAAVQARAAKADEKKIEVDLRCDEDLVVEANALLLEHAVVNLIDNAIKYSDEGSSVRVVAAAQNGGIAIRVIDSGCGIDKKDISRVFERFYRVDKARSRKLGGTGLGLAIVKHIVQVHGGHVTVDSTPGKGSTFVIHLPGAQGRLAAFR